jgi:hypothetical protein
VTSTSTASAPMRKPAAILVLVLATACVSPTGAERSGCGPDRRDAELVVTQTRVVNERPITIDCMHGIANRRIRVGFTLAGGPDCHVLHRVDLVESADAVEVTLIGGTLDDPAAGACPTGDRIAVTEVDLAAPLDDRILLDGADGAGAPAADD